jgi:hypothetical protein
LLHPFFHLDHLPFAAPDRFYKRPFAHLSLEQEECHVDPFLLSC